MMSVRMVTCGWNSLKIFAAIEVGGWIWGIAPCLDGFALETQRLT